MLDTFDLISLAASQRDGRTTHQQLLEQVHLLVNQVEWRLARLELGGVIEGYQVVLSPVGLGLGVMVFASVKLTHHGDAIAERFHERISLLNAVQGCCSVAGDADYILRAVVPSLPVLSEFTMRKLARILGVGNVRPGIVLTALKGDGTLPLPHLGG